MLIGLTGPSKLSEKRFLIGCRFNGPHNLTAANKAKTNLNKKSTQIAPLEVCKKREVTHSDNINQYKQLHFL
jgi:hypothetical protein